MGNFRLLAGVLVAFLISSSTAHKRKTIFGYRFGGGRVTPPATKDLIKERAGVTGEGYFSQLLDHFTDDNTTWNQHYYFNYEFQRRYEGASNNVAFLMIGGEGPESPYWSRNPSLPWMQWADEHNAAVLDLEHRFYGKSQPFARQTVENLKYLSSRQAIEDLAFFIKYINKQNGWTGTKWVVFGGSYPGALAAWFRQAYPELAIGAVGSSGPVQATMDFYEYLQVVENSLAYNGTDNAKGWQFGSNECLNAVKKAFSGVMELMKTPDGRDQLTTNFGLVPGLNELSLNYNDIQYFYQTIFGQFMGIVQYSNGQGRNDADSIAAVCDIMVKTDPMTGLINVAKYLNSDESGNYLGLYNNYTGDVEYLKDDSYNDLDLAAARSWIWQTCTEFGYYQSTDYTPGVFGATSPLSLSINTCIDIYGSQFTADYINKAVKDTNDYYGGTDGYSGTNVVLPNGDLDPWHALGRYRSDHYSQVTYLVEGGSHCGDMYAPSSGDTRFNKIHAIIARQITNWLTGPPEVAKATKNQKDETIARLAKKFPSHAKPFTPKITDFGKKLPDDGFANYPVSRKVPMLRNRPRVITPEFNLNNADLSGYSAFTFTQPNAHFDNTVPETFEQRWWKNTQWARTGGPNFLMIGGEGPANPAKWVLNENVTFTKYAALYGANVYYMEHRCYGESHVLGNSTYKTDYIMGLCNAWESLWDLKLFIETVNDVEGNTAPWITFGGSYSGMLSLWARDKFPNLIAGAVGSSAPINVKLDFYEYMTVVENSLRMYDNDCAEAVKAGFTQMQQLTLTPAGIKTLSDTFSLSPAWDENSKLSEIDLQFFFSNIFGNFQGAVQYSGDNTGWYANNEGDIGGVCAIMKSQSDALQSLAAVNKYMSQYYGATEPFTTFNNYTEMIAELRDLSAGADRTWTYQTCVEFGFFQSTDAGYNIFGSPTPVNMYLQMCYDIFAKDPGAQRIDYSTKQIQQQIDDIYAFFTANFNASNIAAPNGNVDPWHALGLLRETAPGQAIIPINATAHCADMYPERASDPQGLKDARAMIGTLLGQWTQTDPITGSPIDDNSCQVLFVIDGSDTWSSFKAEKIAVQTIANLVYDNQEKNFRANFWMYGDSSQSGALPESFYDQTGDFANAFDELLKSGGRQTVADATNQLNQWDLRAPVIVLFVSSSQSQIDTAGQSYTQRGRTIAVHQNDGMDLSAISEWPDFRVYDYHPLQEQILNVCKRKISF
ncbi:unnamed protein product, partial [Mesorhabditis belari]|uniref:Uncharacterized protein n=1 Tax=Mesorhabditis belari TaxID=2138241 RepID=A0AAF3ETP8_9BILA